MTNGDLVAGIRVSPQPTPGDARPAKDVSRDELSHLWAAGTGDHKDHPNPRKVGQLANRRQDPIGGNENHTDPVSGWVIVPPEKCRGEM